MDEDAKARPSEGVGRGEGSTSTEEEVMELWHYIAIGWVVCGVAAYLILKRAARTRTGQWTQQDRAIAILFAALTGPTFLIAAIFYWIFPESDKPASW